MVKGVYSETYMGWESWHCQDGTNTEKRCLRQDRIGEPESNDSNLNMRPKIKQKPTEARSNRKDGSNKHQPEHAHGTNLKTCIIFWFMKPGSR